MNFSGNIMHSRLLCREMSLNPSLNIQTDTSNQQHIDRTRKTFNSKSFDIRLVCDKHFGKSLLIKHNWMKFTRIDSAGGICRWRRRRRRRRQKKEKNWTGNNNDSDNQCCRQNFLLLLPFLAVFPRFSPLSLSPPFSTFSFLQKLASHLSIGEVVYFARAIKMKICDATSDSRGEEWKRVEWNPDESRRYWFYTLFSSAEREHGNHNARRFVLCWTMSAANRWLVQCLANFSTIFVVVVAGAVCYPR